MNDHSFLTFLSTNCKPAKIFLIKQGSSQTRVGIEANGGEKSQYLFCCELKREGGGCNFSDCKTLLAIIQSDTESKALLFINMTILIKVVE